MKQEGWRTECKRRNNFVPFIQESVRSLEWQQRGKKALVWVKSETPEFCHCLLEHSQHLCSQIQLPAVIFFSPLTEFLCPHHPFERRKQWSRIHVWQLFPLSFNSLWGGRIYKSQLLWLFQVFQQKCTQWPRRRGGIFPQISFKSTENKVYWRMKKCQQTRHNKLSLLAGCVNQLSAA